MIQRGPRQSGLLLMTTRAPEHGFPFTIHGGQSFIATELRIEVIQYLISQPGIVRLVNLYQSTLFGVKCCLRELWKKNFGHKI